MNRTIITISREFGSGGRLVGEKIAKKLGIPFYDRKLIDLAAEKSGLAPEYLEKTENQPASSLLYSLATSAPATSGYLLHYDTPVSDKAFFAQSEVIREIAQQGSAVILGRCGGYILREDPDRLNIFLHGSLDNRLRRATEEYGMDPKGLANILVKTDKGRSNYHKYYTGENWQDIRTYDIAINTETTGIDGAVEILYAMAMNRPEK